MMPLLIDRSKKSPSPPPLLLLLLQRISSPSSAGPTKTSEKVRIRGPSSWLLQRQVRRSGRDHDDAGLRRSPARSFGSGSARKVPTMSARIGCREGRSVQRQGAEVVQGHGAGTWTAVVSRAVEKALPKDEARSGTSLTKTSRRIVSSCSTERAQMLAPWMPYTWASAHSGDIPL